MPDGSIFVASGSLNGFEPSMFANNNPTYEMLDSEGMSSGANVYMDLLARNQPYYMYPFVHLLKDGSLFVFVAKSGQIFDPVANSIVRELPDLPGMFRTYPNTGGSVMLPLRAGSGWEPEIMICGGGEWVDIDSPCDASCGRLRLYSDTSWTMTGMPQPRGMVEALNLLDGSILWLNGVGIGSQGFGMADYPTYDLLAYQPSSGAWHVVATSTIPRLYHSVALLLKDGRVMIAGSNPNEMPVWPEETIPGNQLFQYPTELRIEIFTPWYLQGENANHRPQILGLSSHMLAPGDDFTISFQPVKADQHTEAVLYMGGFVTHSLHMGQQMYFLDILQTAGDTSSEYSLVTINVRLPGIKMAPGPYFIYVLSDGVPSLAEVVTIVKN